MVLQITVTLPLITFPTKIRAGSVFNLRLVHQQQGGKGENRFSAACWTRHKNNSDVMWSRPKNCQQVHDKLINYANSPTFCYQLSEIHN